MSVADPAMSSSFERRERSESNRGKEAYSAGTKEPERRARDVEIDRTRVEYQRESLERTDERLNSLTTETGDDR